MCRRSIRPSRVTSLNTVPFSFLSPERQRCAPIFLQKQTALPLSLRSAGTSTAFLLPSSLQRRALPRSAPNRLLRDWTIDSRCSPAGVERRSRGIKRFVQPLTGAMNFCRTGRVACCVIWRFFPPDSRWRRQLLLRVIPVLPHRQSSKALQTSSPNHLSHWMDRRRPIAGGFLRRYGYMRTRSSPNPAKPNRPRCVMRNFFETSLRFPRTARDHDLLLRRSLSTAERSTMFPRRSTGHSLPSATRQSESC